WTGPWRSLSPPPASVFFLWMPCTRSCYSSWPRTSAACAPCACYGRTSSLTHSSPWPTPPAIRGSLSLRATG
ncbi:hypothetical protein BAE44_0001273, partial [Dichanthelium oligosanthes]